VIIMFLIAGGLNKKNIYLILKNILLI